MNASSPRDEYEGTNGKLCEHTSLVAYLTFYIDLAQ